jgi:P-type E1-E2 ATPase
LILTILCAGAVCFACKELLQFVAGDETKPVAEATEGEQVTADDSALGTTDDAERSLGLSVGSLVLVGAGTLINPVFRLLSVPVLALGIVPLARRGWRTLIDERRLSFEGLLSSGMVLELMLGYTGLCGFGWLIYASGQRLLLATRNRTRDVLSGVFASHDEYAWQLYDGVEILTPIAKIGIDALIVVRAGETIAIDGVVVDGVICVDQRALTGESVMREFVPGDEVFAATLVTSGAATLQVKRTGRETLSSRLEAMLSEAESFEARSSGRAIAEAEASVRPTLAVSIAGLLAYGPIGALSGIWTNSIDSIWLSAPLSAINTIEAAARASIIVKDGRSLEQLETIDTVVFDKTGTLTLDEFEVIGVECRADWTGTELLGLAAALEQRQQHPLARAIIDAAKKAGASLPALDSHANELGYGLRAILDGESVLLGSGRLLALAGVEFPAPVSERIAQLVSTGHSLVHLAVADRYVGTIELLPRIRPEVRAVVTALRVRGLDILIVTGDDEGPTAALAAELGVTRYYSQQLPQDKDQIVAALQAEGRRVCFVGDGINDSLALKRANVSVSMNGASTLALESAQILLQSGSLSQLETLFDLAHHFGKEQRAIVTAGRTMTTASSVGLLFVGLSLPFIVTTYAFVFGLSVAIAALPRFRDYSRPGPLAFPPAASGENERGG